MMQESFEKGYEQGSSDRIPTIDIGQCTNLDATANGVGNITTIVVVDCSEPHSWEAFAEKVMEGDEFPGSEETSAIADDFCYTEFESYLGIPFDDSMYELQSLFPSQGSWVGDDRLISCLAGSPDGGIVGSLKGIKK